MRHGIGSRAETPQMEANQEAKNSPDLVVVAQAARNETLLISVTAARLSSPHSASRSSRTADPCEPY